MAQGQRAQTRPHSPLRGSPWVSQRELGRCSFDLLGSTRHYPSQRGGSDDLPRVTPSLAPGRARASVLLSLVVLSALLVGTPSAHAVNPEIPNGVRFV